MSEPESTPAETSHIVVRAPEDIAHPHLNVWLPRGELPPDAQGNLQLLPNLPHTFEGVAGATEEIETGEDGASAQVYRLVSAELRTPPSTWRRPVPPPREPTNDSVPPTV